MVRSGFLVLDKPEGITSHDLINRARRVLGTRKIGHAGTLDPMATGVMVLGVESATRLLDYVMAGKKRYLATIKMGVLTLTDDRAGETLETVPVNESMMDMAAERLSVMTGLIKQVPSRVSAIKVDGKRAYDRVRDGEDVELKAREVEIFTMKVLSRRQDEFDIDVTCSPGTYIRAIARDVGGHLTSLRRIESKPFTLADCSDLDSPVLIPPATAMSQVMALYEVEAAEQGEIALGRAIPSRSEQLKKSPVEPLRTDLYGVVSSSGDLISLVKPEAGKLQPVVVLPESRSEIAK
ncbi:MAG: tRNA pseudouridine(55) synthase TruB [Candidatus Nanopelagicaceae bacterium]